MMPTVSVVTICLNAEQIIEKTIKSVLSQNMLNYEYLIVDGKSTDATVGIAEKFRDEFRNKGVSYRIFSEKDTGIYNAMNKAARNATGKYIIFMNAGDIFYSNKVLKEFENVLLSGDDFVAVYGNTVMKNRELYHSEISIISDEKYVLTHQSVFTLLKYLKEHPYDEAYRYAADTDCYMKIYRNGLSVKKIDRFVSIFDVTGVSSGKKAEKELKRVREKNGYQKKMSVIVKIRHELKKWVPPFVSRYYYRKSGWTSHIPENIER